MIYVYGGAPRHGKSCKALDDAINDPRFKGRRFYWKHIAGLKTDAPEFARWTELEDVQKWQECEPGSVIIIDEAHNYFPLRGVGAPPDWIAKIAEHGHLGLDFILISQSVKDIDLFVRRRIENYIYIKRPAQMGYANVYTFQGFADCDETVPVDRALRHERYIYNKHIWTLYKSADEGGYSSKARPPRILYMVPVLLALLVGSLWYASHWFKEKQKPVQAAAVPAASPGGAVKPVSTAAAAARADDYVSLSRLSPQARAESVMHDARDWGFDRQPLNDDFPESAPIYDEVRKIRTFPRIAACAASGADCRCFNQQGTHERRVSLTACMDFVVNGRFDPYRDERSEEGKVKAASPAPVVESSSRCVQFLVYGIGGSSSMETRCYPDASGGVAPLQTAQAAGASGAAGVVPAAPAAAPVLAVGNGRILEPVKRGGFVEAR